MDNDNIYIDVLNETDGNVTKAAKILRCSRSTIYNHMNSNSMVYDAKHRAANHRNNLGDIQLTKALASSKKFSDGVTSGDYKESDLCAAIGVNIQSIASVLGMPFVIKYQSEYRLPNRKRCDLLLWHMNGRITIVEVKSSKGSSQPTWLLYPAVGQLLYYLECVLDTTDYNINDIELAIAGDFVPDDYFNRMLKRTTPQIRYINVLPLLAAA